MNSEKKKDMFLLRTPGMIAEFNPRGSHQLSGSSKS